MGCLMILEKTIILESGKCAWGKCLFCSFGKKDAGPADVNFLKQRIDRGVATDERCNPWQRRSRAIDDAPKIHTLKFFNSGSFLDRNQIPLEAQDYLFEKCRNSGIKELIVECRPEFINEKSMDELKPRAGRLKLTFAMGLEVADNRVLEKIQKGMTLAKYEAAAKLLGKSGFGVRTYLMANLPFVGNIQKSLDASVRYAMRLSDSVAIINAFAYGYSGLFRMWVDGEWAPLDKKQFDALVKKYKKNPKIDIYFDDYITYPKFPETMQETLEGVGEKYILHPYFNVWQDYISRFYEVPEGKQYVLFLPCSFRKPYSLSQTHKKIIARISGLRQYPLIHQVMISNPGVIPREFESKYPFAHYDWKEWLETPEIKKQYMGVTEKRIVAYLKTHKYKKVFAYLKPTSESYAALKNACNTLKIRLISCVDEKIYGELKDEIHDAVIGDENNLLTNRKLLDHLAGVMMRHENPRA